MYVETNAALQSIKVISDWLSANKSLKNGNKLAAAISDVNSKLIDAQNSVLEYQARNKSFIEQIADLEKNGPIMSNLTEKYRVMSFTSLNLEGSFT